MKSQPRITPDCDRPDIPGTSPLDPTQQAEMEARFGSRYVAVADGSTGGHTPGRKYGAGKPAAALKPRKRKS